MKSPTELSLNFLREQGYTVAVTEHWNPFGKVRVDLFGIIDLVAIKKGVPGVLGIQTTSRTNISARIKKSIQNKNLLTWYKAGNNFKIHGWYKEKGVWKLEEREVVEQKFLPKIEMR